MDETYNFLVTIKLLSPCLWAMYIYKIVQFLNSSSNFTRFHMVPSVERILAIYSNSPVPLNKIVAIPIYGKST